MSPHIHISEVHALQERVDRLEAEVQRKNEQIGVLLDRNAELQARMYKATTVLDQRGEWVGVANY